MLLVSGYAKVCLRRQGFMKGNTAEDDGNAKDVNSDDKRAVT